VNPGRARERPAPALVGRGTNRTPADIWTRDATQGERPTAEIEAGVVFVNAPRSDPRLPFGGIRTVWFE